MLILGNSNGCLAQEQAPELVSGCNAKAHRACIRITAKEVFADGADGKSDV